jgi:microcin C transport system permease protein
MKLWLYVLRRCVLIIPTLLGITLVTFLFINIAPGGPVEQKLQQIKFGSINHGPGGGLTARDNRGVSKEVLEALKKQYGYDKPLFTRYCIWLKQISHLDFGKSFSFGLPAIDVIKSRLGVSIQFGVVSFILTYLVSIPLGLIMARHENTSVDVGLNVMLLIGSSIPAFALAILLIVFFAGGSFFHFFPMGYLTSENYAHFSTLGKIWDRVYHFILPTICYMIGSFTGLAFLCRNSVLDELKKDYIRAARAKGLTEKLVLYRHALRNALIPLVTGIGGILSIFLAGSLLIENVFQLEGIGMLGYQAMLSRDYNIIMALAFIQSLLLLAGNLVGDLVYIFVDPRIDFT